jgi:hypothetical protein
MTLFRVFAPSKFCVSFLFYLFETSNSLWTSWFQYLTLLGELSGHSIPHCVISSHFPLPFTLKSISFLFSLLQLYGNRQMFQLIRIKWCLSFWWFHLMLITHCITFTAVKLASHQNGEPGESHSREKHHYPRVSVLIILKVNCRTEEFEEWYSIIYSELRNTLFCVCRDLVI